MSLDDFEASMIAVDIEENRVKRCLGGRILVMFWLCSTGEKQKSKIVLRFWLNNWMEILEMGKTGE
jgi:hypothetical protein